MLVDAGADVHTQMQQNYLEDADVLENFDFDSLLNTSADDTFDVDIDGDFGDFGIGQDR